MLSSYSKLIKIQKMLSPLIKKLLFVRQFNISDGKIEILGDRHIMLSADAILELQNIDTTKLYNIIKTATLKQVNTLIEHAKVYKQLKNVIFLNISKLSKKLGGSEGIVKTVQNIFDIYGLGKMVIVSLNNTKKQAIIRIYESSVAQSYLEKNKKKEKKMVCTITAAVIAGIFTYLFNKNVEAVETKCMVSGSDFCEFMVK